MAEIVDVFSLQDSSPDLHPSPKWQTIWKFLIGLLLALIIGRFLVLGTHKVLINHHSSDGDESAYLSLGLALRESGVLSDGTRPPLYPLLLSPFAEREWAYFTTAKRVTLGLSALGILTIFALGVRMFGWEAALLAAFLLAINKEFHSRSVTIYADNLFLLIMLGGWYYLVKSLEEWKSCIMAGLFVGLAYLTKGSAPLLLSAWGLTALLHFRQKILRRFELALVPLAFIGISLPLLVFNANEFGNPIYNFPTRHVMWMDQLAQMHLADPANLPTASSYFAMHTPADIAARVAKGLRRLNPRIAQTLIPNRAFEPAWLGPVLGVAAAGTLLHLSIFKRRALADYVARRRTVLRFTLFLFGFFYLSLTWYVAGSASETRFIIPLLGPFYLLVADAVVSLTRGLGRRLGELRVFGRGGVFLTGYRLALALLIGWGVWWQVDTARAEAFALSIDPYEADRSANAEVEQIVQWLSDDTLTGRARVAFGPSKSLPTWKFPARFTVERLPYEVNTWAAMQATVQSQAPDYIIIDDDTARRRREALSGHFQRRAGLVTFEQIPDGWTLDYVYPSIPCKWCIFSPAPPVDAQPVATLANGLDLLAWRVSEAGGAHSGDSPASQNSPITIPPGTQTIRVILTWRAENPPPGDYTIFVHLTAPDGFVKTQHDQPPFGGARPTSQWQPGETLADRYDLPLGAGIAPGNYLLLTGMYLPATGERLAVLEGPAGPAPETIRLGPVKIAGE